MSDKNNNIDNKVAIALQYDINTMDAPQVVAKGQGYLAEQILKIAKENNVEIKTDAALTEILSVLEIDSFIPLDAYSTVAEILSYIYKKNGEQNNESSKS